MVFQEYVPFGRWQVPDGKAGAGLGSALIYETAMQGRFRPGRSKPSPAGGSRGQFTPVEDGRPLGRPAHGFWFGRGSQRGSL